MFSVNSSESRTRGSDNRRTRGTLRRGIAPYGVVCPRDRRLLLRRHAGRLGAFVSPTAKSHSSFPRTPSSFPFCSSFPLGSGGPILSRPRALIFWRPSRRTGRPCTHCTARFSTLSRMSGQRRDSPSDQVSPQGHHASGRDSLRPHRSGTGSFWDRLLGGFLYGLLRFRHPLLDRMAQPGNLECGHGRRPGAGISAGCAPSVRQTPESPVPPTRAGSGSRRCVYGGAGNLRIR